MGNKLKQLQFEWENNPETDVFYPLACAYIESGLLAAAADVLQQGLVLHPNHSSAIAALGRILFRRNEIDEAREILERALRINFNCIDALYTLTEIEIEAGNFQRAEKWLSRAESIDPVLVDDVGSASVGNIDTADLRLQLASKRRNSAADLTDIPFVTETMVDLYLKQGMDEKAFAALSQLVTYKPEDEGLRRRLNDLHECMYKSIKGVDVQGQFSAWLSAIEYQKQERSRK